MLLIHTGGPPAVVGPGEVQEGRVLREGVQMRANTDREVYQLPASLHAHGDSRHEDRLGPVPGWAEGNHLGQLCGVRYVSWWGEVLVPFFRSSLDPTRPITHCLHSLAHHSPPHSLVYRLRILGRRLLGTCCGGTRAVLLPTRPITRSLARILTL